MRIYKDNSSKKAVATIDYVAGSYLRDIQKAFYKSSGVVKKVFDKTFPAPLSVYDFGLEVPGDPDLVKDLTGNGYDLRMYNVLHRGMSGRGGYLQDFLSTGWYTPAQLVSNATSKSFVIISLTPYGAAGFYINSNNNHFSIKFKVTGVSPGMGLYFGGAISHPDNVYITGDGEFEYTTNDTINCGFRTSATAGDQTGLNILIEQLPEYPGALVLNYNKQNEYVKSVVNLPAFSGNNYTAVTDFDILPPFIESSGVITKQRFYLYKKANGQLQWYNMTGGASVLLEDSTFAFTNNLSFTKGGKIQLNNNPTMADISGELEIGRSSYGYTKMVIRHLIIFNGVNLPYEACVEVLKRAKNGTLP